MKIKSNVAAILSISSILYFIAGTAVLCLEKIHPL